MSYYDRTRPGSRAALQESYNELHKIMLAAAKDRDAMAEKLADIGPKVGIIRTPDEWRTWARNRRGVQ